MAPSGTDVKTPSYAPRARLFDDFVVVEGITRSGKFLLGAVVSAFEGVEFIQTSFTLETLHFLHRLGRIDLDTYRMLVQTDLDMRAYDMAIGRNLNARSADVSCIGRAPDPARFTSRSAEADTGELVRRFREGGFMPLQIFHEGLPNARAFFDVFPKARMISILRDPADLVDSWFRRGWGRRHGANDPLNMSLCFEAPGGPRYWWALDLPEYGELGEMDRCVLNIATLMDMGRRELDAAGPALSERICFVRYEDVLARPDEAVSRIGAFLGRAPVPQLPAVLARERLPRAVDLSKRAKLVEKIRASMSPRFEPLLSKACEDYDGFWTALSRR